MNLSFNWLNDYIDLSQYGAQKTGDLLTMKTCEVEKVYEFFGYLDDYLVAEVKEVKPHPDADKLVVCRVYDGTEEIQIVTGAPNVVAGKKYPVAKIGVTLPGPDGITMKKAKLRGLESYGMLCSAKELLLEDLLSDEEKSMAEKGIMTLPDAFSTGASLRKEMGLDDVIIEIDNKSITHRPDLWSHYGFARELSALTGLPLRFNPLESEFKVDNHTDEKLKPVKVSIEEKSAGGYCSAMLDGIEIKPSSNKMKNRLLAAGMRPINNVVDVSNYVMLELGQPNHAFDRSQIHGDIVISRSKKDEKIITLDSKEYVLPEGLVLIRDGERPVALGGVMGGENTEVTAGTTSLFLESATFHRADIRKAVSETGIRTEASQRFEKGQDPSKAPAAIRRFAVLLKETCENLTMGEVNEFYDEPIKENIITTTTTYLRTRLGNVKIEDKKIKEILENLGMQCTISQETLTVTVPSWRSYFDITIPEDLVEELGRVIGYATITQEPLYVPCRVPAFKNSMRDLEHYLRQIMSSRYAFSEVYNYAFVSEKEFEIDKRFAEKPVKMANAINSDLPYMRISPLPGLLKNIKDNYRRSDELRFFEIERVFLPPNQSKIKGEPASDNLPIEKYFIAGVIAGTKKDETYLEVISAVTKNILARNNFDPYKIKTTRLTGENGRVFHPGRAAQIEFFEARSNDTKPLLRWGQVHPQITDKLDIDRSVFYFEAWLEDILENSHDTSYQIVSKVPAADYEVTVVVPRKTDFATLVETIGFVQQAKPGVDKTVIEQIKHISTYTGDPIPQDQKAVSLQVVLKNHTRTIDHEELRKSLEKTIKNLEKAGYELRS